MNEFIEKIRELANDLPDTKIMEVCGGHTNTIMKYGIREFLPNNIKLVSGPGCPVCVTSQHDIDCMIELSLNGIKVATYGDMINVPGTKMSLANAKTNGADVQTIYSANEIEPDRVFFAVGFETTTPMTAVMLKKGIKVFSAHKVIPPAMKILVEEMNIDGFIDPGHVSAIIGADVWNHMNINVPQVISGFKPDALIRATYLLLKKIKDKDNTVTNDYPEVVSKKGNELAQHLIKGTLKLVDSEWRGLGTIPNSGLDPISDDLNAKIIYKDILSNVVSKENPGCRCGEVIRGMIEPSECALFGNVCTPQNPRGACMVSESEGACGIAFKYGRSLSE